MTEVFSPCVVIPVYNHAHLLGGPLRRIRAMGWPVIAVDDGNGPEQARMLEALCRETGSDYLRQWPNAGKGVAVLRGLSRAHEQGYSHGVQVDADGQHDIEDIPRLLARAEQEPEAVVTGVPQYDHSVPPLRFYSRYLTHFWVWVETLSLQIRDSMCGFRVYPLAPVTALAERVRLGRGMDFDTEILVRLSWAGVAIRSVPTRVIYPEQGLSNFRLWRDNLAITWLHTRLVFGMLVRLPRILGRRLVGPLREAP